MLFYKSIVIILLQICRNHSVYYRFMCENPLLHFFTTLNPKLFLFPLFFWYKQWSWKMAISFSFFWSIKLTQMKRKECTFWYDFGEYLAGFVVIIIKICICKFGITSDAGKITLRMSGHSSNYRWVALACSLKMPWREYALYSVQIPTSPAG